MPNIEITPYSEIYKDQIIQHILKIQTEEFDVPVSIDNQPDLLQIPQFYQTKKGNFWIALDNQQVVGTIALIDIDNNQAALRKMFVKDTYRGKEKGIAESLLKELINWCKKKNICEVYLGTQSNFFAAHRFYEKNGFQETNKASLPKKFPIMRVDTKFYVYRI